MSLRRFTMESIYNQEINKGWNENFREREVREQMKDWCQIKTSMNLQEGLMGTIGETTRFN